MADRQFAAHPARVGKVDRLVYFLRCRGVQVVVLALVANTMVAQLLYNSAGRLVLGNGFVFGYLLFSAACSTVAFALFEICTIFQLHDLMSLDASIKQEIGAEKLIKRGLAGAGGLVADQLRLVLYFLALAWHTRSGTSAKFPLDDLPSPWNWLYFGLHALAYTAVLFLAGIFGERPKSAKEVVLATQRALEQQALERWKMQKEAQIEQMMRDGTPLGAVAAALGSPETAERIALMEAATSGSMSALDAAFLSVKRAGHDTAVLDGLRATSSPPHAASRADPRGGGAVRPFGALGAWRSELVVTAVSSAGVQQRHMTPDERDRLRVAKARFRSRMAPRTLIPAGRCARVLIAR